MFGKNKDKAKTNDTVSILNMMGITRNASGQIFITQSVYDEMFIKDNYKAFSKEIKSIAVKHLNELNMDEAKQLDTHRFLFEYSSCCGRVCAVFDDESRARYIFFLTEYESYIEGKLQFHSI